MKAFCIITFGCQMNTHDSERMAEVLELAGLEQVTQAAAADLVVLNTCSVRAKAEQKLRSEVGRLGRLKRQRPGLVICVAGCVGQQEGARLLRQLPQIDLVIGPDRIPELPALLAELEGGGVPRAAIGFDLDHPAFLATGGLRGRQQATAYVTVMKGCDERCAYCIVPQTRGPERYRDSDEILDEVRRLTAAGVREVTLLGQTVNSYHDPGGRLLAEARSDEAAWQHTSASRARQDETAFPVLLRALAASAPELARLRYTSPHPRHLTRTLVRAHAELPVLVRHLHLPVQSGSDAVLKRMVRRHTVAEYLERVDALRASVPGVSLTTDIIVGFPGETRQQFEQTLSLVREVAFSGLFGFKYSPRPDTPALRLGDDVSEVEKSERLGELFELSNAVRQAQLVALVGTTQQVLVEGRGDEGGYTGRTLRNEIVHFPCADDPTGELVDVLITTPYKNSLAGEMAEITRRPGRLAVGLVDGSRRSLPVV